MSASKYKQLLEKSDSKLLHYQTVAEGWKTVAYDRLAIISSLGKTSEAILQICNERSNPDGCSVGSIMGGNVWNSMDDPSEIIRSLSTNLGSLSDYALRLQGHIEAMEGAIDEAMKAIDDLGNMPMPEAEISVTEVSNEAKDIVARAKGIQSSDTFLPSSNGVMTVPSAKRRTRLPSRNQLPAPSNSSDIFS